MKTMPMPFLLGAALCASALSFTPSCLRTEPPTVAVIGASASHGFALGRYLGSDPAEARARIAAELGREPSAEEYAARTASIGLAALIRDRRGADAAMPLDASDEWLFLGPGRRAAKQIEAVLDSDAQLVLAVDLLFWFGYGGLRPQESEDATAARLARQREGLALLDGMLADARWGQRRLVVGDYPDCSDASEQLIHEGMRPDAAALTQLNAVVATWAKERNEVAVFPLAQLMADMKAGRVTGAGGQVVTADVAMQFDRLHPTARGMELLVDELTAALAKRWPDLGPLTPTVAAAR